MKHKQPTMATVNDCIQYYLEYVAPNRLKPNTYKVARHTLAMWRKQLGDVKLANLTTSHILQQRDAIANPATANRVVSVLSSALRVAVERDALLDNPCKRIRPLRVRNSDAGKIIPDEHWQLIARYGVSSAPCPFNTLLTLLRQTGCRIGEALRLRPDDIRIDDNPLLTFRDTKSNTDRTIPISPTLGRFLAANPLPVSQYRNHWQHAIKPTGVHYRYHDIRHTFITEQLARGVPPMLVGAYVGHGSVAMSQRYFHPDIDAMKKIILNM